MPLSIYTHDPKTLNYSVQYRDGRKRPLPDEAVSKDILRFSRGMRAEMIFLSRQLAAKRITLQHWYDEMSRYMKLSYTTVVNVARGKQQNDLMTAAEIAFLLWLLTKQFDYLNDFALDIASGKVKLDGRFIQRAGMYGSMVKPIFENWRLWTAQQKGYTECRRLLSPTEHCHDSAHAHGCIKLAEMGWMPIAEMIPIGNATCMSNCQCRLVFRRQTAIFPDAPLLPTVAQFKQEDTCGNFIEIRDEKDGRLLFKYDPVARRVEVKHNFMKSPKVVELDRYK